MVDLRAALPMDRQLLGDAYTRALQGYLACPEERALSVAYDLGRQALNEGLGPLDLVMLHEAALQQAPPLRPPLGRGLDLPAAAFLMESLSPFEMTYRRFLEANAALRGVNEALENESRRTARLIHDGAGQLLFTLQLALAELKATLPEKWKDHLDRSFHLADQLDQQLRSLSRDLYPVAVDDLGLNASVRHLLDGVSTRTGLKVSFRSSVPDTLPAGIAICLYRVIHEAISNVVRHARATELDVAMDRRGGDIVCAIKDNGIGLPEGGVQNGGLGLRGIRDRLKGLHGELELTSSPGSGTQLVISVPVSFTERSNGNQGPDC